LCSLKEYIELRSLLRDEYMQINSLKGRLWLCVPIFVTDLLDLTFTMLGQPDEYWKGSYSLVNEFNPFARWLMVRHPIGALIYTILDILMISFLIVVLPLLTAKILSAFWAIGSAKAIYNWLVGPLHMGWWISNLVILIPTIILVYAFEKASASQAHVETKHVNSSLSRLKN
jgi:hypothetical protein